MERSFTITRDSVIRIKDISPFYVAEQKIEDMTLKGNASAVAAVTDIRSRHNDTTFTSSEVQFNDAGNQVRMLKRRENLGTPS